MRTFIVSGENYSTFREPHLSASSGEFLQYKNHTQTHYQSRHLTKLKQSHSIAWWVKPVSTKQLNKNIRQDTKRVRRDAFPISTKSIRYEETASSALLLVRSTKDTCVNSLWFYLYSNKMVAMLHKTQSAVFSLEMVKKIQQYLYFILFKFFCYKFNQFFCTIKFIKRSHCNIPKFNIGLFGWQSFTYIFGISKRELVKGLEEQTAIENYYNIIENLDIVKLR